MNCSDNLLSPCKVARKKTTRLEGVAWSHRATWIWGDVVYEGCGMAKYPVAMMPLGENMPCKSSTTLSMIQAHDVTLPIVSFGNGLERISILPKK